MHSSSSNLRTVIVTGSNKGIGLRIVDGLYSGETPYHIVLTSRTLENAQKAIEEIKNKHPNSKSQLTPKEFDLSESKNIDSFVDWIKSDLKTVDVLINNAAIAQKEGSSEQKVNVIAVNFFRTVELTEKVLPHLADDGKIIFISSGAGALSFQPEKAQEILKDSSLDRTKLMDLVNTFVKGLQEGSQDLLFSDKVACYLTSKALLNSYGRHVFGKQIKSGQQYYVVCPGHCRTDMGGDNALRSPEQGAETPIYLTNAPFEVNEKLQGKFIRDKEVVSWDIGEVPKTRDQ